MKKVLITGASGFIGTHLTRYLTNKEYKVFGLDNKDGNSVDPECTLIIGDILNKNLLREAFKISKPDYVVHLAAQTNIRKANERPDIDANANIMGTLNVLEESLYNKVDKFVFSSSAAVYGNPKMTPVTEDHPKNPVGPYGISKSACEDYVNFYSKERGIRSNILRFSNVYGPGGRGTDLVTSYMDSVEANIPFTIREDGLQTRDFVYVGDVVDGIEKAMKSNSTGTVNISSGKETTVMEVYWKLSDIIGKKQDTRHVPSYGEIRNISLDNSLAKDKIGWEPLTPLERGLKKAVDYRRFLFQI